MTADAPGFRNNHLVQEIFWTRTGLLLLVLLVISSTSLGLSSALPDGVWKSVLFSVGTGLLITAVVSFGQTVLTARSTQLAMLNPVTAAIQQAMREVSAEQRTRHQQYMPSHEFPATNDPDPTFNQLMMADLHAAREYFFRGFSGRHAAARLLLSHAEWELRVVIADPLCQTALSSRARYLLRRSAQEGDSEALEKRLREEIHVGLAGLYLARSRCSRVDLTVVDDPPVNRLEIFDESVWLSLFTEPDGAGLLYPRTLRFAAASLNYGIARAEFMQTCNSRNDKHYAITPETSRAEFFDIFKRITRITLTEDSFHTLVGRFQDFQQDFTIAAKLLPN